MSILTTHHVEFVTLNTLNRRGGDSRATSPPRYNKRRFTAGSRDTFVIRCDNRFIGAPDTTLTTRCACGCCCCCPLITYALLGSVVTRQAPITFKRKVNPGKLTKQNITHEKEKQLNSTLVLVVFRGLNLSIYTRMMLGSTLGTLPQAACDCSDVNVLSLRFSISEARHVRAYGFGAIQNLFDTVVRRHHL